MFLSKLVRKSEDDRGMALVAVIALTAVTAVIGVTVGAITVQSFQTTNGVAGSVEARAAAQAGIAQAELLLRTDTGSGTACPAGGVVQSTGNPAYRTEIFSDNLAGGWTATPACPPAEATRVKLVSTGFPDRGVNGGGEVVVEAIFMYIPEYVPIPVVDPAIYAYSIEGILKKFVLDSVDNSLTADLQIKTGDFECSNNARVAGDVILGDGYADLTACTITGTLHTTRYALVQGGSRVNGDIIASGNGVAASDNTVLVAAGTQVDGNIFSGGNVEVLSSSASGVTGNVTAARDTSTNVLIANGSTVSGNVLSSGTIASSGAVAGTRSTGVTGLIIPPNPLVPEWVNMPWTGTVAGSTWEGQGYTQANVVTWSGNCTIGSGDPRWSALAGYTQPTIIDATACTNGIETRNNLSPDIALRADIVFFADSFTFQKLYIDSVTAVNRKVFFIVPDNNPNAVPSCEGEAGDVTLTNEADLQPKVSAFIYTPCRIYSDRDGFRGQMYGGEVEFGQQAQLTFVPTSPPGVDFTAGAPPVMQLSGAYLGERLTIREITSGG